jgi:CheY-like chemotaxis protein
MRERRRGFHADRFRLGFAADATIIRRRHPSTAAMAHHQFVKVVGFSAAERHALNTVFRLSDEGRRAYALWTPEASDAPSLLLLDGETAEARAELALPQADGARVIWVGADAPAGSWRVFDRPISWPHVVQAIDRLFEPAASVTTGDGEVDFDLGDDNGPDTQPPDTLPPEPVSPQPRALVASADREQRLYLRARLALAGLTAVDETDSGGQAVELAKRLTYCLAIVEHHAPEVDAWSVLKRLRALGADRPSVILTKPHASPLDRLRAWVGRAAFLSTPPDPAQLDAAIRRVVAINEQAAPVLVAQPTR